MPEEYVKAASVGDLAPGEKKLVRLGPERILLANVDGEYYAVDELCPHAYALLSRGQLDGDELMCPLHASSFNVRTGQVLSPPCAEDLTVYPVTIEGEDILVGPPA